MRLLPTRRSRSWRSPAHGLHDVEQQGGCQVRAQVDEGRERHDGQPQRVLIIFFQGGPTVMAPAKETGQRSPRSLTGVARYKRIHLFFFLGESWKNPQKEASGPFLTINRTLEH